MKGFGDIWSDWQDDVAATDCEHDRKLQEIAGQVETESGYTSSSGRVFGPIELDDLVSSGMDYQDAVDVVIADALAHETDHVGYAA